MEKGLITQNISNKFEVETNTGIYVCDARGKFKMEDIKPVHQLLPPLQVPLQIPGEYRR